jgi:RHS repeat-associated protein
VTEAVSGEQVVCTYDSLKRLSKSETVQAGGTHWGQSFGYDAFGNLVTKNPTAGHTGTTMQVTVDATTNRLTTAGFAYDANGNMTGMPAVPQNVALAYDVENRTGGGWYDQQNQPLNRDGGWNLYGLREERLGTYSYAMGSQIYNVGDHLFVLRTATETQTSRNLYFGGRLIVSNGTPVVTDALGSVRSNADSNGAAFGYYPYGENIGSSPGGGREQFATYTREAGNGLDYANQRYYVAVFGRFNTPDRYQSNAPRKNSATWNRYSYAVGDPVNLNDPSGHFTCFDCDDGPLSCLVGYHWDEFDGVCRPDNTAPPNKGDDSHPADPACSISLFERPVGVALVGFFADHTYLFVEDATGDETIEGGPDLIDYPVGYLIGTLSRPFGHGLKGTNPLSTDNRRVGSSFSSAFACTLAGQIEVAESRYKTSGKWAKYDPIALVL